MHGRAVVFDPLRLSWQGDKYPHHVSPNDIVFHTKPRFFLRRASNAFITNEEHDFGIQTPYPLARDELLQDGQPWLLHMCMDNPPKDIDFYFFINDWNYTVLFSGGIMDLPRYSEPYTVRCSKYQHCINTAYMGFTR